ncbi:TIM-barrel domain-containing protein [Clostridium saccharoperbutylacetonicum]|uniref:glycoside hydrolase family 31 protein n=1 Tax=Clostridium saccharoperbutylacetonicum TaxID=36745 RepID=UPI000983AEC3|nr:TIM-barrel domain-containing protein [Clostridium saccharoperbutylacetonicum]AQR97328.1 alpha-xylosidase BoGH31A precursor [Clostridium saccharoperbutylacetonicum]NSB33211.1 alpha-glucosidase [Clostridium saccharoperbutylacetonicum]
MLLKRFLSMDKIENGYLVKGDTADIKIIFMSDDIIRIRTSFDKKWSEESYALVMTAWEDRLDSLFKDERKRITALDISFEETEKEIIFNTKTLKLVMSKEPLYFSIYKLNGEKIYGDLADRAFECDQLGRISHYNEVDLENDHFYGFGEKTGKVDKMGRRMRMSPKDAIGHDPEFGDPLYKHIPFYIKLNNNNRHALGLFYHNSYDSVFDMGNEISGYWPRYSYYQADGGDIDLFFINGPKVEDVLDNYTKLTGRQAMPPKQSLGYTASTMYYAELEKDCDKEIYEVIKKHFDEKMYIDNFKLASGYSSGEEDNLRYIFNWNRKRFPNPDEFLEKMNEMGLNVIPNLKPGILPKHPYKKEFEDNDVFIKNPDGDGDYHGRWWGGTGRFVDFTKASGRETWKKLLKENILSKGTITVWNDNCEYDGIEDRNALCDFDGKPGTMAELKIMHSNMMAYVGKEAIAELYPNRRPYIINRAGFAGIQRYAQTWAGDNLTDWRTLKFNIATIIGMGLSGVANTGCDIGGFAGGAPEGELLLRWIQNGIFQPRFCINSANNDNTVTQPWMYEENNEFVRHAYRQRYRMLPYLYSLMYEAHTTGRSIMRPLFMEFQDDINCYDDKYMTFMFGPSVLVANVLEKGAVSREIYLPEGCTWYDMNNNMMAYNGGQVIQIPVSLDSIPMFLRGDGIFITNEEVTHITTDKMKSLDILIGGEAERSFKFYDDDGISKDFEKGVYENTEISVSGGARKKISFKTTGSYENEISELRIKLVSKEKGAYWVSVDNERIPRFLNKTSWEKSEQGWYYELSDRTVLVKCKKPEKKEFDIIVSCERFDLIGMGDE